MPAILGGANLLMGVANTLNPSRLGWINLLVATLLMYAPGRIHEFCSFTITADFSFPGKYLIFT